MSILTIVYLVVLGFGQLCYWMICLCEAATPFHEYAAWKKVQETRKKMASNIRGYEKQAYADICEKEKDYARDVLFSIGLFFAIALWPVAIGIALLGVVIWLLISMFTFFKNSPGIFSAARGKFEDVS